MRTLVSVSVSVLERFDCTQMGSWSHGFLAETVETGNKNHCVTEATHVLRKNLRKMNAI